MTGSYIYSNAQVSSGGNPISIQEKMLEVELPVFQLEDRNNTQLKEKYQSFNDNAEDLNIYGEDIDVNLNINSNGTWTSLSSGKQIWRLNIKSSSAKGLQVIFDQFYLPPSSKLFIYSKDKSKVIGAFTSINNKPNLKFATRVIEANDIIIEYNSGQATTKPILKIKSITHVFIERYWLSRGNFGKALECHNDVNCSPWNTEWCNEIRSVVLFDIAIQDRDLETNDITISRAGGICSGGILNNANQDFDPLILTSSHCVTRNEQGLLNGREVERTFVLPETWIVYYNFQSPTCDPSQNGNDRMTTVGVDILYEGTGNFSCGDMALLRVSDNDYQIPLQYNVFFAGWNSRDELEIDDELIAIHHPRTDIKKITSGKFVGKIEGDCFYQMELIDGIIEGGSSGSPLFDKNSHQVIGNGSYGTVPRADVTCETPGNINYGNLANYFGDIIQYLSPNNLLIQEVDGADPIGICQTNAELSGPFYPGHDWQAKNNITIQVANELSTILNTDLPKNRIIQSDINHTNLNNKADYTFVAGKSIQLKAGFIVEKGNRFNAKIGECQEFEGCGFNSEARRRPLTNTSSNHEENLKKRFSTNETISIFPNPTTGNLSINLPHLKSNMNNRLVILNSLGQMVMTQDILLKTMDLDISRLLNGLYFVQIFQDEQVLKTEKIILSK